MSRISVLKRSISMAVAGLVVVGLPLLAPPCRDGLVSGNVGVVRLPMADRSKPGQVRGRCPRHDLQSR